MVTTTLHNTKATIPAYRHIEAEIRRQIASGELCEGAILPPRAALAKYHGVGLATLERAIAGLISDGTLRAVPGQYTAVAAPVIDSNQSHVSYSHPSNASRLAEKTLGLLSHEPLWSGGPSQCVESWTYSAAACLERSLFRNGGVTRLASLRPNADFPTRPIEEALGELIDQGVAAVAIIDVVGGIDPLEISKAAEILARERILLVYLSNAETTAPIPHVYYDSPFLGWQAISHLIDRGHKRFAYVSPFRYAWSLDRCEQARMMADAAGLGADAVTPLFGDGSRLVVGRHHNEQYYAAGLEYGRDLFRRGDYPRCIVAANDAVAYGLIDASVECGLRQGVDYAILGFDNAEMSLRYGLTTFCPPLEEIGNEAALLLNRLERGEKCSMQIRFRSRLVARLSTMQKVNDS